VLAWEQEQPGGGNNHLAFRYFASRTALLAGQVARSFDAPRQLSACPEGTPNIYGITLSPDIDQLQPLEYCSAADLRRRAPLLECRWQHR
jgi:hypothetical protein